MKLASVLNAALLAGVISAFPVRAELVVHYNYEEGSGTTVNDLANADSTATPTDNGLLQGAGVNFVAPNAGGLALGNSALSFTGTGSYISLTNNGVITSPTVADFLTAAPGVTFSAWVNLSSVPAGTYTLFYASRGTGGTSSNIRWGANVLNTGAIQNQYRVGGTLQNGLTTAASTLSAGVWTYVTATLAFNTPSGNMSWAIYTNGISAASGTVVDVETGFGGNTETPSNVTIGGIAGTQSFNGLMDEVEVYNNALSGPQIQGLYNTYVPEPSAFAVLGLGITGWLLRVSRRHSAFRR